MDSFCTRRLALFDRKHNAGEPSAASLTFSAQLLFYPSNLPLHKAADEEGALESADFLGKKRVIKKSWGYHSGKASRNYSEYEEHKIKPHHLRNLSKYTAVIVHCEHGHRRKLLPPRESDGKIPRWFAY